MPKPVDAVDLARGERIRRRRKYLGKSQERLAADSRMSLSSVKRYERGANIHMENIEPLAVALGWTPAELIGEPAPKRPVNTHYKAFLDWLTRSPYGDVSPGILRALESMNPPEAELLEEDYRAIFRILYDRQKEGE